MNILLPLLFVFFGCENDVKPLWLSGTWKGTFKDTHTSTDPKTHFVDQPSYPAELRYKVSTNSGTVSYPTLGCTSNWVFLKMDNDTLFFEEKIVSDKNQLGCVDKMHYKLFQLSKNEIAIIGNGKTPKGSSIETNGVLAKIDYKNIASTKVSSQKEETLQNTLSRTNSEYLEKPSINKSEQTVSNSVPNPQLRSNAIRNTASNTNSIVGSWLSKVVLKANMEVTIYKVVYKDDNSYSVYKNNEFSFSGYYLFAENKRSYTDVNGNIKNTDEINWTDNNRFFIISKNKSKHFYSRENSVKDVSEIRGSLIYGDNGELLSISDGGSSEPPPRGKTYNCPACWGTKTEYCSTCLGRGSIKYQVQKERYNGSTDRYETYYEDAYQDCSGGCNNGLVKCSACNGKGFINSGRN